MDENAVQRLIVRLRWPIFILAALVIVSAHNGQWRLGRDSSLYREVADNLASGKGYTYRGQRENHSYPGLPYFLASIDKVFGRQDPLQPRAALVIMMILGLLTLAVIYYLVRTYFPPWVAISVTFGVAINNQFLQQTHELMTDLPFLLGACMTMLGIARIPTAATMPRRIGFVALIVLGAILAITMRPTYWALFFAWLGACFVGLLHSRRRLAWGIGLGIAAGILLLWIALDPRSATRSLTGGRYEKKVVATLRHLKDVKWRDNLSRLSTRHLPEFFFGLEMPMPIGPIICGTLLVSSILLVRKSPFWGLYVAVTLAMTIVLGGAARYYLMILPLLLLGWAVFAQWISRHSARLWRLPYFGELVLLFWLSLATVPHLVHDAGLILEQHGYTRNFTHQGFLNLYREGRARQLVAISKEVSQRVPQGEVVLGLEPRITTYLSGRTVYTPGELLTRVRQARWPETLRKKKPTWMFYDPKQKSKMIPRMLATKTVIIAPGTHPTAEGIILAPITIGEAITHNTKTGRPPRNRPTTRPTTLPATRPAPAR